jgi:hypothetical protein
MCEERNKIKQNERKKKRERERIEESILRLFSDMSLIDDIELEEYEM